MGTISGTTHMKTILSFLPGIGNAFYSSDDPFSQLFHILHFFMINSEKSNVEMRGPENGPSSSYPVIKELPLQKGTNTCEVVHHLTGRLFPQGHDTKQCFPL
jgi:hypothetical protein